MRHVYRAPLAAAVAALVVVAAQTAVAGQRLETSSQLLSGPTPYAGCPAALDGDLRGMTGEVSVARDPARPHRLAAAWMQDLRGSNALGVQIALSDDDGRSWHPGGRSLVSICAGGTTDLVRDPTLTWARDGSVYLATVYGDEEGQEPTGIQVSRSADGGVTWAPPVPIVAAPYFVANADAPIVVAGQQPGVAYLHFSTARPGVLPLAVNDFYATEDFGRTWTARTAVPVPPGTVFPALELHAGPTGLVAVGVAVDPATLTLGLPSLAGVAMPEQAPKTTAPVVLTRSADGGRTWDEPVEVGRIAYPSQEVRDPDSGLFVEYLRADAVVDQRDGRVHVVWQEAAPSGWSVHHRATVGSTSALGPEHTFARTTGPAFQPTLGIDPMGDLAFALYDFDADRAGDGRTTTTIRLHRSRDDGASWWRADLLPSFDLSRSLNMGFLFVGNQHSLVGGRHGFAFAMTVAGELAGGQPDGLLAGRLRVRD